MNFFYLILLAAAAAALFFILLALVRKIRKSTAMKRQADQEYQDAVNFINKGLRNEITLKENLNYETAVPEQETREEEKGMTTAEQEPCPPEIQHKTQPSNNGTGDTDPDDLIQEDESDRNEPDPSQILFYKTRGNASPQGRPRIYFCCHPDDFQNTFGPITDELLEIQKNAVIWYRDPAKPFPEDEQFLSDLGLMQLFVIPVTSRFLYQDDPSRTKEMAFAFQSHIPVLPLMQESGLENDFNEICGELQFLDKSAAAKDSTALPYEEKLRKFLEAVLVGDKTAARIREAFDAYIFLSYRKKDRAEAQKIMRLIHKNEFCRDMAIWYDEFLTPGENFNKEINAAMKKSRLFALVVTPSLLEDPNYVQTQEYPSAVKQEKDILPVIAKDTDAEKLIKMYEGIENYSPTGDPANVTDRLHTLLHDIALQEDKHDPSHHFLIGLAYLSGIDVEVDHERAVRLITEAADAGLPEACEKLVTMYRTGEGVERDFHEALSRQEQLVQLLLQKASDTQNINSYEKLFAAQVDLCDFQQELGKLNEAKETGKSMINTARKLISLQADNAWRYTAICYDKLGDIGRAEGNLSEAKEWYEKGLKIREQIARENPGLTADQDLPINYDYLGMISESSGDPQDAKIWYEKSLNIREKLAGETGTLYARRNLCISYDMLGSVFEKTGAPDQAAEMYEKHLALSKQIAEETGELQDLRNLALSWSRAGIIYRGKKLFDKAKECFEKSSEISRDLFNKTGTVGSQRDLAVALENLGDTYKNEGNLKKAGILYQESFDLREKILEKTGTLDSRQDYAVCFFKIAGLNEAEGHPRKAKASYLKGISLIEEIPPEKRSVNTDHILFTGYNRLGMLCSQEGQTKKAEEWYQKSRQINENIARRVHTAEACHDAFLGYYNQGIDRHKEGKTAEAKELYEKALAELQKSEDFSDDLLIRRDLALCYHRFGDLSRAENQLQEAKDYYEKSLALLEGIFDETGSPEARLDLADLYDSFAACAKASRDPMESLRALIQRAYNVSTGKSVEPVENKEEESAKSWYEKSLELRRTVVEENPSPAAEQDLFISFMNMGEYANGEGKKDEAKEWYEKAIALSERSESSGTWKDLIVCYQRLGDISSDKKDDAQAIEYYKKGIEAREVFFQITGSAESARDIVVNCHKLGKIYKNQDNLSEAKIWYEKGLEIAGQIARDTGTVQSRKDLALSHYNMGMLEIIPDDQRLVHWQQFLEISKALNAENQDVKYIMWAEKARQEIAILKSKIRS